MTPVFLRKLRNHTNFADCDHHLGSIFTGTALNGRAKLLHRTRLCGPFIATIASFSDHQIDRNSDSENILSYDMSGQLCKCSVYFLKHTVLNVFKRGVGKTTANVYLAIVHMRSK